MKPLSRIRWALFVVMVIVFLWPTAHVFAQQLPPSQNPEYNISVLGWTPVNAAHTLVNISGPTDDLAPELSTLLPGQTRPTITGTYQMNDWNWATNQSVPSGSNWQSTMIGLQTSPGQNVLLPHSGYDIGQGYQAMIMYADSNSLTLKYTREDSVSTGYTLYLDHLQVDQRLIDLYNAANASGRTSLPGLPAGALLGFANGELLVAIRDTGTFLDPRSAKDWWKDIAAVISTISPTPFPIQRGVVPHNVRSEPNYGLPEESTVACPPDDGSGGGLSTYHPPFGASPTPEMRSNAGLNLGTGGVKGRNCGQAKGEPIQLQESVKFPPPPESQCKVMEWTGNISINNESGSGVAVPFAQELADHFAGTWDIDHVSETEMDQKWQQALGVNATLDEQAKAQQEITARSGVLKMILPAHEQDRLRCDFLNYVRRKGNSIHRSETVDGIPLTSIPCPPNLSNPNVSVAEQQTWEQQYQKPWSRLALFPNEKSVGKISFLVCADRTYNTYSAYPEVMRLGLASNELFKLFNPETALAKYYTGDLRNFRNPLQSRELLADRPIDHPNEQSISESEDTIMSSLAEIPAARLASFSQAFEKISSSPKLLAMGPASVLADAGDRPNNPGEVLQGNITILPGPGFNYSVTVSKTPLGWQMFPGTIGDVQVNFVGGTPHTQNLFSDLQFDTTNPRTAGFLPRFNNEQELRDALARGLIYFRADTVGFPPHPFNSIGGVLAGPPACDPSKSCCGNETANVACTPSCIICSRAQLGPSDTTGAFTSDDSRNVPIGDPVVTWNFTQEGWDGRSPLPDNCNLEEDEEGKIHVSCVKSHDRTVDIHNFVPYLSSVWDQAAGHTGDTWGFFNAFKVDSLKGNGLTTALGCTDDTNVVLDQNGNFVPNPGATSVDYTFKQTSGTNGVTVRLTDGSDKKLLFYRIGGVCNADKMISAKAFMPDGKINTFFNPAENTPGL